MATFQLNSFLKKEPLFRIEKQSFGVGLSFRTRASNGLFFHEAHMDSVCLYAMTLFSGSNIDCLMNMKVSV